MTRPNVLILYPDQWRADALGCAGNSVVQTPYLDRLAREGLRATHAFVANPVCTPSRGSFMTGRYPHSTGVTHNQAPLPATETCFAEQFVAAGYRTGYIGKWHLDGEARPGFVPPERRHGWQYWAAFNRGHNYHDGVYFRDTPEPLPAPGFEPDHQTDLAIGFLEEAASRREQPFCLFVSWGPPHTPLEPPERHRHTYAPERLPLPASVPPEIAGVARQERAPYYGLVTALDDNVGRLLDALDRLGLAEDTLVLFTSDHGDSLGEHGLFRKTIPYDEATRVPLIARWPGHIPAGTVSDALIHSVDIAPTLLALAGAVALPDAQGYNLAGALLDGSNGPRRAAYIAGHVATGNAQWPTHPLPEHWRALRTADHLLVTDQDGAVALQFDLRADPLALENLASRPEARSAREELLAHLLVEARAAGDPLALGAG